MPSSLPRLTALIFSLLLSLPVFAMSVGEATLSSKLGQPLYATIPLNGLGDLRADQVIIKHAPGEIYDKLGIERPALFQSVQFDLTTEGDNGQVVLRTRESVNEPYVRLLLQIRWPSGEMVKEITLFIDPVTP